MSASTSLSLWWISGLGMLSVIEMSSCTPHHRGHHVTTRLPGPSLNIPVDPVPPQLVRIHQECGLSQYTACVSAHLLRFSKKTDGQRVILSLQYFLLVLPHVPVLRFPYPQCQRCLDGRVTLRKQISHALQRMQAEPYPDRCRLFQNGSDRPPLLLII